MDSRDQNPPPPPRQLPTMMMGPASYSTTTASHHMINPNSSPATMMHPRFDFNSVVGRPTSSELLDTMAAPTGIYDGSSSSGFSIEPSKKKRGRPRKYAPEGNIALGLGPTTEPPSSGGHAVGTSSPPSEPQSKKHRGRPPGSGKKQLDALGTGGVGFTPHVILVKAGEDVAAKIVAFSQQGPRTVCILSANGAVCSVTLKQPAMSGAPVSYEGRFEIISLSGSFLLQEGDSAENSGLSVSLAGSDGRVLGGGVAGMLIAATPVQVIVGSFVTNGKKPTNNLKKSALQSAQQQQQPHTLNFGGAEPVAAANPPSQEPSSQSSDDDGGSPEDNRPSVGGYYNDMSQNQQPLPNMQMYHPHLWASQAHR